LKKSAHNNVLENLFFLTIFVYPIKFLSYKFFGIDISLFKILASTFIVISSYKNGISRFKNFNWILVPAVVLFVLNLDNFNSRIIINVINYALIVAFLATSAAYLKKIDKRIIHFNLVRMAKLWRLLVLLALLQVALDLLGWTLSYEAIGEYTPENRGELMGYFLLRPNSVFGEPRDLSAFAVFALVGERILRKKSTHNSYMLAVFIGLLTQSATFFLVIGLIAIFHLFRRLGYYAYSLIPLLYLGSVGFITWVSQIVPRIRNISNISLSQLTSLEFSEQAGDFSFFFYLSEWYVNFNMFMFGNGIGSSNRIIGNVVYKYFPLKEEFVIINSRWLFYNLLVDLGFISCLLLFLLMRGFYKQLDSRFKHLFILSVAFSMFTSNYFFVIILVLCLEFSKKGIAT
jgi:hypothetical protein